MIRVTALLIGDELLDGRISDQNATWLAGELGQRGGELESILVVPDELDRIVSALETASSEAELVVCSGGLGPTSDDVTREAAAAWVDDDLVLDDEMLEELKARFEDHGYPFTENNRRQCEFPSSANVLETKVGTAAGFEVSRRGTTAVFLPGVPSEFEWFCERQILPRFEGDQTGIIRQNLTFLGLGESQLETRLDGIEELTDSLDARISYRANYPVIDVDLKAGDDDKISDLRAFVLDRIGGWLASEDDTPVAQRLGELLLERGETVTIAESCTAGWLGKEMTSVSGSSGWFERGFITYSNQAKEEMLGVDPELLEAYGAVSPQVVCQMARGAADRADAEYALAISGIAGPSGGTDEKPVGTVDFALATPEGAWQRRVTFPDRGRESIRHFSVYTALALLIWRLDDRLDQHRVEGPFADEDIWSPGGIEL